MKVLPPKRRVILYGGIVLIIACFFIFSEPFVNGHFFSTWLRYGTELNPGGWREPSIPDVSEIEAAIRKTGPKAIPILLEKLDATDAPWKRRIDEWQGNATWLPDWMEIRFRRADRGQMEAIYGFYVLGTQAVAAIPELSKRLTNTNNSWAVATCLGNIGTAAVPALKDALTNQQSFVRDSVLRQMNGNNDLARLLLPECRRLKNDPDPAIARFAQFQLIFHSPTNDAAELIHEAFKSDSESIVGMTIYNLSRFSPSPRQFIPELSNCLVHPSPRVRLRATNVLKQVDLAAAFAAGVNTNPPIRATNAPSGRGRRR